jgi:uncharacterized membrane protein YkoI
MGRTTPRVMVVAGTAAAVAAGTVTLAAAAAGDDTDTPITGDAKAKAMDAALASTTGGRITATEVGEDSNCEVEVTLADGHQVDVQLDAHFHVVSSQADRGG